VARKFLTPIDMTGLEIRHLRIENIETEPSVNPAQSELYKGRIYFNSSTNKLFYYNGASWEQTGAAVLNVYSGQSSPPSQASVDLLTEGLYFSASSGITVEVSDSPIPSVTIGIDSTVLTESGQQTASNKTFVDSFLGSDLNASGKAITNLATPFNPSDAANKSYVDGVSQGLDIKQSVNFRIDALLDATVFDWLTTPGQVNKPALGGGNQGVGTRVLITNALLSGTNFSGIYELQEFPATGTYMFVPTADGGPNLSLGAFTFVEQGTDANKGYVLSTTGWTQFSGAGTYTAGIGLTQNGTAFDVVPGLGILATSTTGVGIDTSIVARKFSLLVGDDLNTTFEISHGLDTLDVQVQVYDATTYENVECGIKRTTQAKVEVSFATPPLLGAYKVVIVG
jgi:hypothetical protein